MNRSTDVCADDVSCHKLLVCAILAGANNVALAFGPAIGAKVLSYNAAAPVAAVCAALGVVLFGEPPQHPRVSPQWLQSSSNHLMLGLRCRCEGCANIWRLLEGLGSSAGLSRDGSRGLIVAPGYPHHMATDIALLQGTRGASPWRG